MRVVIALGGNAMTAKDGSARPDDQRLAIESAMRPVADLIADGVQVVLTHGNGPQVGNLLTKNEIAADVVPPVPLDWCGAQTQGTVGFLILNALDAELESRGIPSRPVAVVTRTLVDPADPGFRSPSKPVGRYVSETEAKRMMGYGQMWEDRGERGWRRVVASPEPMEIIEIPTIRNLLEAGAIPVAAGGGGIPVVREGDRLRGVEAVLDKDLSAALLATRVGADIMIIATDVDYAMIGFGTPSQSELKNVTSTQLREYAAAGHFASGSMGPKVEAACRMAEDGGIAVITSLTKIRDAVRNVGTVGTVVSDRSI
jgi:carbamate kinase